MAVRLQLLKVVVLDMSANLWDNDPELQKRFDSIRAEIKRLQAEFGIEPRTIEQRYADMLQRQQQEAAARAALERQQAELARLQSIRKPLVSLRRPGK